MDRLTEINESLCTYCDGIGFCKDDCPSKKRYDRLAAYEDTGLTPEEIQEAVDLFKDWRDADIPKELKSWVERCTWHVRKCEELLRELDKYKKAEAEGRLLILPYKVGTVVYGISTPCGGCEILTAALDKDITLETALNSTCKTCPNATVEEIKFDVDLLAEWGEWVFATREEAEAALERGKQ